jgi:lipooligosaccharide transport system permease protein
MRLEMHRTYEAVLATPASADDIITGDILWGTTRATLNATYILVVLLILHPVVEAVRSPWALMIVPIAVLQGFLFSSMAMSFASFARSMSHFGYLFNLVILPMFWLSGGFFPLDNMPDWAQRAAWFMPLVHSVELNRAAMTGEIGAGLLVDLAWLVVGGWVCYQLALTLMRRRLIV